MAESRTSSRAESRSRSSSKSRSSSRSRSRSPSGSTSSSTSSEVPSSPCGYLISHNASLIHLPSDPKDISHVPGGTEFILQDDFDHTDPFKDNTIFVCVTCLFPLTESDRNIIDRVKIGLALDKEFTTKIHTVFVSLTSPKEVQSNGRTTKTIELNVGLPLFSQVTSQEVIDYLTKYFGSSYKIVRDRYGILTSISPVTLKQTTVAVDDEVSYYSLPTATKFRFYPVDNADVDHKYRLLELNSEQTILSYNSSKDVYTVPAIKLLGTSNSFKLKDITIQSVGGDLSVILTYYFNQQEPLDIEPILVQQLQSYQFKNINVYSIINRRVSVYGASNIITASISTSVSMIPEDFAQLSREIQSVVSEFGGSSMTVMPVFGPEHLQN